MKAPEHWRRGGPLAQLLRPAGWLYAAAGRWRRQVVSPWRAPVPVICIGNLTAGGAGKTPVAIDVAARLQRRGLKVHVLSRGYGGVEPGPLRVDRDRHDWRRVGDEAQLLCRVAPTWVAADRRAGARAACADGAQAIVMDDGLQNPALAKTLSLVVVDGGYGFGNGYVIPAGPLREPVAEGLARADGVVIVGDDKTDIAATVRRLAPGLVVLAARLEAQDPASLSGRKVLAFAGIGRPEKFFETLKAIGADIVERRSFADHHAYEKDEISAVLKRAEQLTAVAVTTAKDAVKLDPAQLARIKVLDVVVRWEHPDALEALLAQAVTHG